MKYTEQNGTIYVNDLKYYDLRQIFDCGQCFRFQPNQDGVWSGVTCGKYLQLVQRHPNTVEITGVTVEEFETYIKTFLCLSEDYEPIRADIAAHFPEDPVMKEAMEFGSGIRILRQEPWEAICSFIISQNNNIPRIKKIIETLAQTFGEPIGGGHYAFPTADALANAGTERIFACRTGFRAKYLYDAALKVTSGEIILDEIAEMTTKDAAAVLQTIKGVGSKVAACALLFGFGKLDAFPIDVWMKRILHEYYQDRLNTALLGRYAGIAQQYLFYYIRNRKPSEELTERIS